MKKGGTIVRTEYKNKEWRGGRTERRHMMQKLDDIMSWSYARRLLLPCLYV